MQRTEPPRFRPTLWPSEPRELPPVAIYDHPHQAARVQIGVKALPDDFVLREVLAVTGEGFDSFFTEWGRFGDDRGEAERNVSVLQALVRHYIAASEGDDTAILVAWEEHTDLLAFNPAAARVAGVDLHEHKLAVAGEQWEHRVNEALASFPMHIRLTPSRGIPLAELQGASTYAVAVLQLAQMASEGRAVLRCANEMCPHSGWLTRQRSDRRKYEGTGHASGVKYCSASCANAQSERERRRRRRDEAKGSR